MKKKEQPPQQVSKDKDEDIRDVVVVGDLHTGCRLGLCHPGMVSLDGGGTYQLSSLQKDVWEHWQFFWNSWVPKITKRRPYAVIINGDSMDGVHHNSTTQISHNLADQAAIAETILKPIVKKCKGRFYMTRGTEAHVGKSAQEEERLAKVLKAKKNKYGQHSRFDLRYDIAGELIHIAHHIGCTSSAAYETSAIHREVVRMLNDAARWGRQVPRVVVRSHRHAAVQTQVPAQGGDVFGAIVAAWQLKTPFDSRRGDVSPPQLGGLVVRLGADGRVYPIHHVVPQIDDEIAKDKG